MYLYSSVTSDVTIDVVNLNDYSLEGDLIQPSQHKFRLKITHPQTETHEFYANDADSFYLWFATFDRLTSKRKEPKTIVQEKIQQNQLSMRDARNRSRHGLSSLLQEDKGVKRFHLILFMNKSFLVSHWGHAEGVQHAESWVEFKV